MIRRRHVVALALVFALGACSGEPVGRKCDLGSLTPQSTEVVVASPSLDCVTRTCLRVPLGIDPADLPEGSEYPGEKVGLCTAECESSDDCERVPESPCVSGFTCGVAVTVGPFCCRKFCICKDYIVVPESGTPTTPKACDASITENACCNLEGRAGNTGQYPLCKE